MIDLKQDVKDYLLIKYAESKFIQSSKHMSKQISWINRTSLLNTIETHFKVLLKALINQTTIKSLRKKKFFIDSIIKYTLGKSENIIKTTGRMKDIKSYMQLNSFIVYDEVMKGFCENKCKRVINSNIEKQLSEIQEKLNLRVNINDLLEEKISNQN